MSKLLNPKTEPSVSCGFFNSYGDRKYYATELSRIFDGIVNDGVFLSIGECFTVTPDSGNIVIVGTGKCWFDHTWTENDAPLPIDLGTDEYKAPDYLNRIDAIVIEVNSTNSVRDNSIKVLKGVEATEPVRPELTKSENVHQYALCYIYRAEGSTEITTADITNVVGSSETPHITAVVDPEIDLSIYIDQWRAQLENFVNSEEADLDKFMTDKENGFNQWYSQMTTLMENAIAETNAWTDEQQAYILNWFEEFKDALGSEDVAAALYLKVDREEIERILLVGFLDGTKTFSEDGKTITSVDTLGRTLVKTFSDDFLTCTTVFTDVTGAEIGRAAKTFASDGATISTEVTLADRVNSVIIDWGTE